MSDFLIALLFTNVKLSQSYLKSLPYCILSKETTPSKELEKHLINPPSPPSRLTSFSSKGRMYNHLTPIYSYTVSTNGDQPGLSYFAACVNKSIPDIFVLKVSIMVILMESVIFEFL